MSIYHEENLLILTKTYPTPSKSYRETVCVAAINDKHEMRRLYPIRYRDLAENKKFKRWQWINAKITKSSDKRLESFNIDNDSIIIGNTIGTGNKWQERISWIESNIYTNFNEIENKRLNNNTSLGFIKPVAFSLIINESKEKEWTKDQLEALMADGLFDNVNGTSKPIVKKYLLIFIMNM